MNEGDEDFELDQLAAEYHKRGARVVGEEMLESTSGKSKKRPVDRSDLYSDDSGDSDSDYDVEESVGEKKRSKAEKKFKKETLKDGFEVVPKQAGMLIESTVFSFCSKCFAGF